MNTEPVSVSKTVRKQGNSYVLVISEEVRRLGLRVNDRVRVTIQPIIRPDAPIIGADGNVFNLTSICMKALRDAGMAEEAEELSDRVWACDSYDKALSIMTEYITPVESDEEPEDIPSWRPIIGRFQDIYGVILESAVLTAFNGLTEPVLCSQFAEKVCDTLSEELQVIKSEEPEVFWGAYNSIIDRLTENGSVVIVNGQVMPRKG